MSKQASLFKFYGSSVFRRASANKPPNKLGDAEDIVKRDVKPVVKRYC